MDEREDDAHHSEKYHKKFLVIWNGADEGTSGQLFLALSNFLAKRYRVRKSRNPVFRGSFLTKLAGISSSNVQRVRAIFWCNSLVVHSYAAFSLPSILLARFLQREIVVFHWDVYPVRCGGKTIGGRARRVFDWIENLTCRLATTVVVPSEDFSPFVNHRNVAIMPLWPNSNGSVSANFIRETQKHHCTRVVFAGQLGVTRGLEHAILLLGSTFDTPVELEIFGPSPPQESMKTLCPNVRVTYRGMESRSSLKRKIRDFDFGLICLNPSMETPGFPSKVFEYVDADLPILYTGPSLPAFEEMLAQTGVGIVIRNGETTQLAQPRSWGDAKASFYRRTSLNWKKIENVL